MLTINQDLKSLIPALTADEYQQLEANLLAEGCRDPLVVWQEQQILLDGHHRVELCERHGLPYAVHEISLQDMDAAKAWMIANQLGRRNLTLDQMRYYRGKQYELHKKVKRGGGDRKSHEARDQKPQSEAFDTTAHELAVQHKVSKATIERDAVYAKAIDTIADVVGTEARQALLSPETKVTQQEVKALAKIATKHALTAKEALDAVQGAKTPKQARQIVREKVREVRTYEQRMDEIARSNLPEDAWPASLRAPRPKPVEERAWEHVYEEKLARLLQKALWSLGALQSHLSHLSGDATWRAEHLPAVLNRQLELCLRLEECWHLVEGLLTDSDVLCRAIMGKPAMQFRLTRAHRTTARALVEQLGPGHTRFLIAELQARLGDAITEEPAPDPAEEAAPRARPAVTPGTVEAALLAAFQAHAPAGYRPKEAASAIGKPGGNVSGALQTLCYKGYLRKEGAAYVLAWPHGTTTAASVAETS